MIRPRLTTAQEEFMIKSIATWLLAAVVIGTLGLTLSGCSKADDKTIRIGAYFSKSGSEATFGLSSEKGLMMAVDELNRKLARITCVG